jgi:hypothetical protein
MDLSAGEGDEKGGLRSEEGRRKSGLGIALLGNREGERTILRSIGLILSSFESHAAPCDKRGHSQPFDWHTSLITTPDQLTLLVRTNPVILAQAQDS